MTDQGELLPDPQYIAVKFNPCDQRAYTYENPYSPVKIGDEVRVGVPSGGIEVVKVTSITKKPKFKCKQIVRPK